MTIDFHAQANQEIAPFNIGATIIEPGGARTGFTFGSAKLGPRMGVYNDTPAGRVHTMLQDTSRLPIGDPAKMVKIMVDSVEQNPAESCRRIRSTRACTKALSFPASGPRMRGVLVSRGSPRLLEQYRPLIIASEIIPLKEKDLMLMANGAGIAIEAHRSVPDAAVVLTKAVVRGAKLLGVNQATVAQALGVSTSTASRMFGGQYRLDSSKKEWELASLMVRLFRSLDSLVGGSETHMRAWVSSDNRGLRARPIDLLVSAEGLVRVVHYLDAARGRI